MKPLKTFSFVKNAICILGATLFIVSCGPSKEEIERRKQEEKAKIDLAVNIFKKHKPEADEFMKKLLDVRGILKRQDSTIVFSGDMDPALKVQGYNDSSNVMVITHETLMDTAFEAYGHDFGVFFGGKQKTALDAYKRIAEGKSSDIYEFGYMDAREVEAMAASASIKSTPYALVLKKDTVVPIKIEGDKQYSGGETLGYAWLVDLRKAEVIGHFSIYAIPSSIKVKKSEGDFSIQRKAQASADVDASNQISKWLETFKGAKIN